MGRNIAELIITEKRVIEVGLDEVKDAVIGHLRMRGYDIPVNYEVELKLGEYSCLGGYYTPSTLTIKVPPK